MKSICSETVPRLCGAGLLAFALLLPGCGSDEETPTTDAGARPRPANAGQTGESGGTDAENVAGGRAASSDRKTTGGADGAQTSPTAGPATAGSGQTPVLPAPGGAAGGTPPAEKPRTLSATAEEVEKAREAFEQLVQAQQDENPDAWSAAEQTLNKSPAAAVPVLVEALDHSEPRIRELAASLLVTTAGQDDRVNAALVQALEDPSPYVRANAAAALSYLPDQADVVVEQLMQLLEHEDTLLQMTATVALGNAGSKAKPAVGRLMELAASEDTAQDIRRAAVVTLGRIGPAASGALPMIEQLEEQTKEDLEQAALLAAVQDAIRLITAPPMEEDVPPAGDGGAAGGAGPSLGAPTAGQSNGS